MPNHTSTKLEITGSKEEIKAFVDKAKSAEEGQFDLNVFVPMPEELNTGEGLAFDKKSDSELIEKYGSDNWYDWSVKNWGSKWNCYDVGEWDWSSTFAVITYQTAWSPVTQFYLTVSKDYPTLTFEHSFADEGGGFLGSEKIKNGEIVKSVDLGWNSNEGIELRRELDCYYEEEEEEDEELISK